jgi:N-acetylneuraminic acid mutarotase
MGISMSKSITLLLVLFFLTASCIVIAKPAFSSVAVAEDSWISKAPMHEARSGVGVAVVNGKIYAIGGSTQSGQWPNIRGGTVGTNEEYDPATDTWTFKVPLPTPRHVFATAVCQNKIYCIGGYTSNGTVTGVNEVYDPATDTWENKAPMPTARIGLQANTANGKIYLIGGYVPAYYTTQNFSSSFLTLNEVYDPATDSWAKKAPMPTAASNYASAVVDNKIYLIGGLFKSEEFTLNQIYDPKTDTWRQGTPSPSITAYGAAGATTGVNAPKRIYILGQDFSFPEPPYINRVYDPENNSWTFGVAVPTNRRGLVVAVVNDMLYAIGGYTETYSDLFSNSCVTPYATNEQYTPIGYGTIPPVISVLSPENNSTYASSNVSLVFTVNKPALWLGYSLDGQETVTVTGNTTLTGLINGLHNITIYAKDEFENTGTAETIPFTIAKEPEPFPATLVATVAFSIVAIATGLLVYFRKRKH